MSNNFSILKFILYICRMIINLICMKKIIITMIVVLTTMTAWAQTYKFYQTDNIHNQLRLNTKTGEVSQIQDDNQTFLVHPSTTQDNEISNKYELFKTKNMWTYILLDKDTGKLWQCQYSVKRKVEYRSSGQSIL